MREVAVNDIVEAVCKGYIDACVNVNEDVLSALNHALDNEHQPAARDVLGLLIDNADIARTQNLPLCQDTGIACVFVKLGQDVRIVGGGLKDSINHGVSEAVRTGYLRASVVVDPIKRVNSNDNTPCVFHVDIVEGDVFNITLLPKGFGSENMSVMRMFNPNEPVDDIVEFIVSSVLDAGSKPCPPVIVGVGMGGTADYSLVLAKQALLRPLSVPNTDPFYANLEQQIQDKINRHGVGAQGFGGNNTCLKVAIEQYATHIAGLPVGINISCHALRRAVLEL